MHQMHWKLIDYTHAREYNIDNFVFMNATGQTHYYCGPGHIGLSDQHFKRISYFLSISVCSYIEQFSNNCCWIALKRCVRFLVCFVELKHCAFEFWGLGEVSAGALSNPLADNQTTSREKIKPFQAHESCHVMTSVAAKKITTKWLR